MITRQSGPMGFAIGTVVVLSLLPLHNPARAQDLGSTEMEVYGHVMLDMGYQTKQNDPDWFDVVRPTKLPSFANEYGDDGNFFTSVRQTRLGVRTDTPTKHGPLKTIFEFELFGVGDDAGQTTFRLRHAWGELGQFGAGQYWSVFMDIDVFPNSIEYWGPTGMVSLSQRPGPLDARGRTRQVHASRCPWSGRAPVVTAGVSPTESNSTASQGDFEMPDIAAHFRWVDDWGHVQIAGILRRIEWNDLNNDQFDLSGSETGWGLNLSTNVKLGRPCAARLAGIYGEAIQNYMNDASGLISVSSENFHQPRQVRWLGKPIPLLAQ